MSMLTVTMSIDTRRALPQQSMAITKTTHRWPGSISVSVDWRSTNGCGRSRGIRGGGFTRAHPGPRPGLGDRLFAAVRRRDDRGHDGDHLGSVRAFRVNLIQFAPVQLAAARGCRTDQLRLWLVPDLPDRLRRRRAIHRRPELGAAMRDWAQLSPPTMTQRITKPGFTSVMNGAGSL